VEVNDAHESAAKHAAASNANGWVITAFVALAVLAGPVTGSIASASRSVLLWNSGAGFAIRSAMGGAALLLVAFVRRERMLRAREFLALLVLELPLWLAGLLNPPAVRSIPWLHETGWGVAFLIGLAAPLWLGLLGALEWVREETPRAVAGASIAGIGAVLLVIPIGAYAVSPGQLPVAVLHVLLGALTVFSWSYARPRLAATGTAAMAGSFLLLSALGGAAAWLLTARGAWQPLDWREVALPLALTAAVNAACWWLWFCLLQRMTLAAFGMRALAAWTAAILPGFLLFGFLSWRADCALTIAVAALIVALRAPAPEEQPLALGLGGP